MEQNSQQAELEEPLGQWGEGVRSMAAVQEAHHAKCSLQRMLEIVVLHVQRLIAGEFPAETRASPGKCLIDELWITARENLKEQPLAFSRHPREILRIYRPAHCHVP